MSTVFLGTNAFAAAILKRLALSGDHRPTLVVTRPDRPRGRGRRLASPPVVEAVRALGIPLAQPESVNDPQARELIAQAAPSAVVVCAFGALIKEPLLSTHEILNVHPSLLPRWRGAAPIERAIMAGDAETGVSIMRLTAGLDSGPVCLAASEPIRADDSYGSLAPRLSDIGGELLVRALEEAPPFVQQAEEGASYAEKIGSEDRLLDPTRPAAELERRVRALHPHIGAHATLDDGALLGVHRAALVEEECSGEGQVRRNANVDAVGPGVTVREDRLLLDCVTGTLELLVVQPPGGRPMDSASYLRGHGLPGRR